MWDGARIFFLVRAGSAQPTLPALERAPARESYVEKLDRWARDIWRTERTSPLVLIALPAWLSIRVWHQLCKLFGAAAYFVRHHAAKMTWLSALRRFAGNALAWASAEFAEFWRLARRTEALPQNIDREAPENTAPPSLFPLSQVATQPPLTAADAVIFSPSTIADFDDLFSLIPRLGIAAPLPTSLHIVLSDNLLASGECTQALLQRLRSGCPFAKAWLYTSSDTTARTLTDLIGARVHAMEEADLAAITHIAAPSRLETEQPSFEIEAFGPVILQISALWGRVGSTTIFDAQTRTLIVGGAIVVRILVDHNPMPGDKGKMRRQRLLAENFRDARAHCTRVIERNQDFRFRRQLLRSRAYRESSAVGRLDIELALSACAESDLLDWGGVAAASVVNHAPHVGLAERLSAAPIILETHDVLTEQMNSHGWPSFVSLEGEPKEQREREQQLLWRRAAICVNLSPQDHARIRPHAKASFLVRPYAQRTTLQPRPWADVLSANNLPRSLLEREHFDVLLWGDWHHGNVRAVEWALQEMREVDPRLSTATFAIVGRVCELATGTIRRLPGVSFFGFVDQIEDFFARARVLAIADRDGSGVSIKALDAVRHGLPFVSTRAGLRGLDLEGVAYTPTDSAEAFAADLARLLSDPDALSSRRSVADALYERNFSPGVYAEQWQSILENAAPDRKTQAHERLTAAPRVARPGLSLELRSPSNKPQPLAVDAPPAVGSAPLVVTTSRLALTAVVCTYDRYDVLAGAINSLLRQNIDQEQFEIVVVDNSPDQAAARRFAQAYQGSRVRYQFESTPGLSNARNVGAGVGRGQYVAYIDDDAVAAPDWAGNLVAGLQAFGPRAGVAGGRIVPRWLAPRPDWLADELLGNLSIVDWGGQTRELGALEWLAGCNIAFDRETLLHVGGFSRALGRVGSGVALLSNEESEVIEKFSMLNRTAIYVPGALVEHLIEPGRLTQGWFRRRAAWQAVSDYIKDPKKASTYAKVAAERLRQELVDAPGSPPGFCRDGSQRDVFRRDVGLMYDMVVAMLAGGVELDNNGTPAALRERILAGARRLMQKHPDLRRTLGRILSLVQR